MKSDRVYILFKTDAPDGVPETKIHAVYSNARKGVLDLLILGKYDVLVYHTGRQEIREHNIDGPVKHIRKSIGNCVACGPHQLIAYKVKH